MRHFFARVAGESFPNSDGSDRQAIIVSCCVAEPLSLEPEPDNPVDENAVRVCRLDGKQIGYLEREMAARLVDDLSDFSAFIAGVGRGGGPGYLGVSLLIVVNDGESGSRVNAYARRVLEAEGNLDRSSPAAPEAGDASEHRKTTHRIGGSSSASGRDDVPLHWKLVTLVAVAAGTTAAVWWFLS